MLATHWNLPKITLKKTNVHNSDDADVFILHMQPWLLLGYLYKLYLLFVDNIFYLLKHDKVDPSTGEAEDDGVEDEYQLEDFEVSAADYILKVGVSNFRNAWESMDAETEREDEYGLGPRESLGEAVRAVISLLGMQPCEVSSLISLSFLFEDSVSIFYMG